MSTVLRVVVGIVVVAGAALLIASGGPGGPDDERGRVSRTSPLPPVSSVDRRDETGLETVRGYLRGALDCSDRGRRVMSDLSREGERRAARVVAGACRAGAPWGAEAELRMREITVGDRRQWEVAFDGPDAPEGLVIRLRQWEPGWEVDGVASR